MIESIDLNLSPFLTIPELVKYLKVSKASVRRLISRYGLPYRKHGGKIVCLKADVDEWSTKQVKVNEQDKTSRFEEARRRRRGLKGIS